MFLFFTVQTCIANNYGTFSKIRVANNAKFIVVVQLHSKGKVFELAVTPYRQEDLNFQVEEDAIEAFKQKPQTFSLYKRDSPEATVEIIKDGIILHSLDVCLEVMGSYEEPDVYPMFCDIKWEEYTEVSSSTSPSFNPIPRPFSTSSHRSDKSREPFIVLPEPSNSSRIS
jgi:hypothetical protein